MREIIFRGKREDTGEWVMGMPCATEQSGIYAIQTLQGGIFDIVPETLGQYIGLTDKNGVKVFEGDILVRFCTGSEKEYIEGAVIYGEFNCSCCNSVYGWTIDGGDIRELAEHPTVYIVGNIHDNPELLRRATL